MITAAVLISLVHVLWVVLVVCSALWTRGRPRWSALHILALLSAIATQTNAFPCPLTLAGQYFETQAGLPLYHGRFVVHYLNVFVNPNIPAWLVSAVGVALCCLNLAIYALRF